MRGIPMNGTTIRWGRLALVGAIGLFALFADSVQAQVPGMITFQGSLKDRPDPPNPPVPVNGCLRMVFRVYTDTGPQASPAWTEVHEGTQPGGNCVQVTNGQFSTELGSITPFSTVPT